MNSHRYFVVYYLCCVNASKQKIECIGAALTVVSFAAVVWSRHTTPSIPRWRESALRDETNNGCEKDYA